MVIIYYIIQLEIARENLESSIQSHSSSTSVQEYNGYFKFAHRIIIIIHDIVIKNTINISFINCSDCFQSTLTQRWPAEGKQKSKQDYNYYSIVLELCFIL